MALINRSSEKSTD